MEQDSHEQAPPGVVEDPGKDDGEAHRSKNELADRKPVRSNDRPCGQEQRQMPAAPEEPQDERPQQGTLLLLQARQGKATPPGFLAQSAREDFED